MCAIGAVQKPQHAQSANGRSAEEVTGEAWHPPQPCAGPAAQLLDGIAWRKYVSQVETYGFLGEPLRRTRLTAQRIP